MKLLLPILLVFGLALLVATFEVEDRKHDQHWEKFKGKHGRKFKDGTHEARRKRNFIKNSEAIETHNKNRKRHQHTVAVNRFADWQEEDIQKLMSENDPDNDPIPAPDGNRSPFLLDRQSLPASVDLRTSPCMAPIKYQGGCGSCYSFAATTPLEYQRCQKNGNQLTILSEKNIIDCSSAYGNLGCNGGLALRAWNYMMTYGIDTNQSYPYVAEAGTCAFSNSSFGAKVTRWYYATTTQNEDEIKQAVATYGPVGVSVDANYWVFYESGIFSDSRCSKTSTNHAVTIVGYGTDPVSNMDYWIIRNSWSTVWGVQGYILMQRGVNMCGVAKRAVYPIAA